jgi:hypothetical protein
MTSDTSHRDLIAALWALTGALAADEEGQPSGCCAAALAAITTALGSDQFVLLHEQEGALHVNGRQLRLHMGVFPAAHGLAQLFRQAGIRELLLEPGMDAAELLERLRPLVASKMAPAMGMRPLRGAVAAVAADSPAALAAGRATRSAVATGLPSMFLQHQLMAAIPRDWLLPPHACKLVLQAVVERLLQSRAGLEALELLQRDPQRLAAGLRVASLCVVFLRVAGWPAQQLAELGVAALLADLPAPEGAAGDPAGAFLWLLGRGQDDLWLRSALVAQAWQEVAADSLHELGLGCDGIAAFVRFAAAVDAGFLQSGDAAGAIAAAQRQCRLPQEIGEVARVALLGPVAQAR